jgi:hypothetical protein
MLDFYFHSSSLPLSCALYSHKTFNIKHKILTFDHEYFQHIAKIYNWTENKFLKIDAHSSYVFNSPFSFFFLLFEIEIET